MAEIPGSNQGWLNPEDFDRDLYRLMCVFSASRPLAESSKNRDDVYGWTRSMFEQREISRLLLSIAVQARNAIDSATHRPEWASKTDREKVGELHVGTDEKHTTTDLTFREACNKIIHADEVYFDSDGKKGTHVPPLNPVVHLCGHKGDVPWKATIDIFSFVEAGFIAV